MDSKAEASPVPLQTAREEEADAAPAPPPPPPAGGSRQEVEYTVPLSTKLTYLGAYFLLNLSLTLYNKAVLQDFPFPWLLTALHATSASAGCYVLVSRRGAKPARLGTREKAVLLAFSVLFTANIAMSNISLALVSVPFHQIMRSACPVFTVLLYRLWFARTYSRGTYLSLAPIIAGAGLATYGDYYFSALGFVLTLAGVLLASVKTVASNRLMTGSLGLSALEILLRMSPLAALQSLACAYFTGELAGFAAYVHEGALTRAKCAALLGNGLLALALNISSFSANKKAGALTMTVCANVKQCLAILLGILLFGVRVGPVNGLGMFVALLGAAAFSKAELDSKTAAGSRARVADEEAAAAAAAGAAEGSSAGREQR